MRYKVVTLVTKKKNIYNNSSRVFRCYQLSNTPYYIPIIYDNNDSKDIKCGISLQTRMQYDPHRLLLPCTQPIFD